MIMCCFLSLETSEKNQKIVKYKQIEKVLMKSEGLLQSYSDILKTT